MKNEVVDIFNDLDDFRRFCVRFGYRYNEADLYRYKSTAYGAYLRFKNGKKVVNGWNRDSRSRNNHRR